LKHELIPLLLNGLAVVTDGAQVPEWVQLLAYGDLRSDHGPFVNDDQAMAEMIRAFSSKGNDVVIDYEHQTLKDIQAPAGGWIKELQARPSGLWARVDWTDRARSYIANKEYRYLSPVVLVRKSDRRAVILHSVALTNAPAVHGMQPLINKIDLSGLQKEDDSVKEFLLKICKALGLPETTSEDDVLKAIQGLQAAGAVVAHKDVLAALGVADGATKDQVLAAVTGLKGAGDLVANKEILELLEVPETADLNTVKGKILALKNPSGYVRVEEFNALKTKLDLRDRDELVQMAMRAGKIAPAQRAWADEYALKDPAGFKAFVDCAPEVVPLNQRVADAPGGGGRPALDEAQLMINKQLGIDDETFKKYAGK